MSFNRKTSTAVIALLLTAAAVMPAAAGDQYSFPSASGTMIAATTSQFVPPAVGNADANAVAPELGGAIAMTGASKFNNIPLPIGSPDYKARYGVHSPSADAYAYRFITHALASQSFTNYAADYYRLFAPGYAVTAWTDRVAGFVETGYGAVDSWTGGAYYLGRVRGPSGRRNSPPDLSKMPVFRPHPELETHPTFDK